MSNYIKKRLLQVIPVVFGITILTFFISGHITQRWLRKGGSRHE